MIQRIQSVYLFAAFILLEVTASVLYAAPDIVLEDYRLPLAVALAAAGLAGLAAVFLFKNRRLQLKTVRGIAAMSVLLLLLLFGAFFVSGDLKMLATKGAYGVLLGLFGPSILSVVLFQRAAKAIKRDIDLVRSMDRIR